MSGNTVQTLLVEDNPADAALLRQTLAGTTHGHFALTHARRLNEALDYLGRQRFDVLLLDLGLPDSHGLQTLLRVLERSPETPVVVLTGLDDEATGMGALKQGAQDYLVKGDMSGAMMARAIRYAIERKAAEHTASRSRNESRESESKFRELAETIREVFWICDPDCTKIHYISPAYEEVWGRSRESLYKDARAFVEAIVPEDRARVLAALDKLAIAGMDDEYRIMRPDGTFRSIHARGFAVRGENGQVTRVVGIAEDISTRKMTETALRQSEAMLARAQQVANIGSWDWDIHTGKLLWSEQYYRISDVSPSEFTPTYESVLNQIHSDDRAHVKRAVEKALAGEQRYCTEYRITARDGSVRVVLAQGDVDRDEAGAPIRMVGTALDVTERNKAAAALKKAHDELEHRVEQRTAELHQAVEALRRSEAELKQSKEAAEAANRAKSGFLANMSHEIRTPMTAILGFADMLLDPAQSDSDRLERVQTIRRNGEHLLAILNDILDLSKIEAGKMEIEEIAIDPCEIVSDVISLMRVRALEKGITLDVNYLGQIPQTIQSDPTRLRQILINLVGNAIKFTQAGGVTVQVTLGQNHNPGPQLEFAVIDSGIGMSPDEVRGLFRPFEQADSSTTRRFGGTGLGLNICKRLAQMLGGDIAVQSRSGGGSRFTVTVRPGDLTGVPIVRAEHEALTPRIVHAEPPRAIRLNARILLAEDGVHNQRVIAFYLQKAGAQVTVAGNGQIACDMACQSRAAGTPFDVILMDMQMPVMDGYTAAATLRARDWTGPIIALTAHAMSYDRARCIQSGCTDHVSKPIDRELLVATVARYLEGATGATPRKSAVKSGPAAQGPLSSTLAEDEDLAQFLPGFIADLPSMVNLLSAAMHEDNLDELRREIHQLKGIGGLYGFMPVTDLAERVEQQVIARNDTRAVADDVQSLINLIRRIEGYEFSKETIPAKGTQ